MLLDDNADDTASLSLEPAEADLLVAEPPVAPLLSHGEPFELFLRDGQRRYAVRFSIGDLDYEGSTACEELDLALIVARVAYVETCDSLGVDHRSAMRTLPATAAMPPATSSNPLSAGARL